LVDFRARQMCKLMLIEDVNMDKQANSIRHWAIVTSMKYISYANLCIQFRNSIDIKKTAGRVLNGYNVACRRGGDCSRPVWDTDASTCRQLNY